MGVSTLFNADQIQAEKYERTSERKAYRNGHRERQLTTRVGTLTLTVPRLRNGDFSTELRTPVVECILIGEIEHLNR
ncbi:MAG: Transposase [Clostridiales bacterium 38_11]|nr:MAG: Transposase [Clostridiales bacterium 38_11]